MTTERDLINQMLYREKKGRTEGIEIGVARGKAMDEPRALK